MSPTNRRVLREQAAVLAEAGVWHEWISPACGAGIAASGSIGRSLAELAAGRTTTYDVRLFRPDRFTPLIP